MEVLAALGRRDEAGDGERGPRVPDHPLSSPVSPRYDINTSESCASPILIHYTNTSHVRRGAAQHRPHHSHSVRNPSCCRHSRTRALTSASHLIVHRVCLPPPRRYGSHVLSDQFSLGAVATGDLTLLLTAIQTTSKFIATNVRKARLINL